MKKGSRLESIIEISAWAAVIFAFVDVLALVTIVWSEGYLPVHLWLLGSALVVLSGPLLWFLLALRGMLPYWQRPVANRLEREQSVRLVSAVRWAGFPRVWELLGFVLGRRIRERIYTPVHHELLEDYVLAKRYRTKWSRRWLAFCFTLRTLLLLAECLRAALADKGAQLLLKLMPEPVRHWWATKGP